MARPSRTNRTASTILRRAATEAPGLARLEPRTVLSATLQPDGVLLLEGDAQNNTIVIIQTSTNGSVAVQGVPGVADGTVFAAVKKVRVEADAGDDDVSVEGEPLKLDGAIMRFEFFGEDGNDTMRASTRADTLNGGNGDDTLYGQGGNDTLKGVAGNDFLAGQGQKDTLEGGEGNDILLGGANPDVLRGGNGNDDLRGGAGGDSLSGGAGEDDLYGGKSDDTLLGEDERDLLRGELSELVDFVSTDAFHSPVIGTGDEALALLSDTFWTAVGEQVGNSDLSPRVKDALDSLQTLRSRAADELLVFNEAFAELTPQEQADARLEFQGIIDDFLDDVAENPEELSAGRMELFALNVRDEFPEEVRGEFDAYIEAMIELDNDLENLGDAIDDLEDDAQAQPYLDEFGRLFVF